MNSFLQLETMMLMGLGVMPRIYVFMFTCSLSINLLWVFCDVLFLWKYIHQCTEETKEWSESKRQIFQIFLLDNAGG